MKELISAREDAQPLVRWSGGELRRYRDEVFVLRPMPDAEAAANGLLLRPGEWLPLEPSMGAIRLCEDGAGGIDPALAVAGLRVRYREGGEKIRIGGNTRKLKKLMQEAGLLPWMRERIPLLHAGEDLVAVGDLWVSSAHRSVPGFVVEWRDRPAIS